MKHLKNLETLLIILAFGAVVASPAFARSENGHQQRFTWSALNVHQQWSPRNPSNFITEDRNYVGSLARRPQANRRERDCFFLVEDFAHRALRQTGKARMSLLRRSVLAGMAGEKPRRPQFVGIVSGMPTTPAGPWLRA